MDKWYWRSSHNIEPREPVDWSTFEQFVAQGTIGRKDHAWNREYADWQRVSDVLSRNGVPPPFIVSQEKARSTSDSSPVPYPDAWLLLP